MNKFLLIATLAALPLFAADPALDTLWRYQGTWEFTKNTFGGPPVTNKIQNDCTVVGQFFVCQQTVDGKVVALLTFFPSQTKGHYYAAPILPNGKGVAHGELVIEGDRWTYPGKREIGGKTIYTRVVNIFAGNDRVHFEQAESPDGVSWKVLESGEEVRKSPAGTLPAPRH